MLYSTFEWDVALGEMNAGAKLWNALFMSVTARTAGFNTLNYATKICSAWRRLSSAGWSAPSDRT